jgi:hypothetical protein
LSRKGIADFRQDHLYPGSPRPFADDLRLGLAVIADITLRGNNGLMHSGIIDNG